MEVARRLLERASKIDPHHIPVWQVLFLGLACISPHRPDWKGTGRVKRESCLQQLLVSSHSGGLLTVVMAVA